MWDLERFSGLPSWASGRGVTAASPLSHVTALLSLLEFLADHSCTQISSNTIALPCFSPALCCYENPYHFRFPRTWGAQRPRHRNPSVLLGDAEDPQREDERASPRICPFCQFPTICISLTCCAVLKHNRSPRIVIPPWLLGIPRHQFHVAMQMSHPHQSFP